jgi:signal transduction histidine kinase
MTFELWSAILAAAFCVGLGLFAYAKNPSNASCRSFALLNLFLAAWIPTDFIRYIPDHHTALTIYRLCYIGGSFIAFTLLMFMWSIVGHQSSRIYRLTKWSAIAFAVLSQTSWIIKDIQTQVGAGNPIVESHGPLYLGFMLYFILGFTFAMVPVIFGYGKAVGEKKKQLQYVGFALFLGLVALINFFANQINNHVPPFFYFLVIGISATFAVAIMKHHLMNISIVVKKTLLYSFVSAFLAAMYAGIVTLLARLVENGPNSILLLPSDIFRWFGSNLQLSFAYSCIATAIFSVWFGAFILKKDPRNKVNVLWCLFCFSVAVWSFGLGMASRSRSFPEALFWVRYFDHTGSIMIPALFVHFISTAINLRIPRATRLLYAIALILQVLDISGNFVSVRPTPPFNFYAFPLANYKYFVIYFFVSVLYGHGLILAKIKQSRDHERAQLVYLFLASAIGFCGGSTTFFPVYNIPMFPYGVYAIPLYFVFIGYAIFKHQLLDIRIVIQKTLLYSLVSVALVAVYVGTITLLAQIWGGRHGPASAFSSALAAIFITILFNPVRIHFQHWVDRHFPRETLDPVLLQEAAGGFAHEMKRPLAKMSLPAELALVDLERVKTGEKSFMEALPAIQERLRFIISQSAEAGYMIEAVRELSATSAAPFEPVDLAGVISAALAAEKDLLERRGVISTLNLPQNLPSVSGRAKQLEIVFVNLIKNAAEAMGDLSDGQARNLAIEGDLNGSGIVIRIKDTGTGIKPEDISKVFQPHYSTKGARGTGIGLYLSQQIVQAHSGTIEVVSSSGNGTEFILKLPSKGKHL